MNQGNYGTGRKTLRRRGQARLRRDPPSGRIGKAPAGSLKAGCAAWLSCPSCWSSSFGEATAGDGGGFFISLRRSCWSSTATVWRGVKNRGEINGKIKGGAQLMGRLLFCRRFLVQKNMGASFLPVGSSFRQIGRLFLPVGSSFPPFRFRFSFTVPLSSVLSSALASPAFRPSPFRCARGLLRIIPFSSPRRPCCRPCRLPSRSP